MTDNNKVSSSLNDRLKVLYEKGKIHPLTYKYIILENDRVKNRFLIIKDRELKRNRG